MTDAVLVPVGMGCCLAIHPKTLGVNEVSSGSMGESVNCILSRILGYLQPLAPMSCFLSALVLTQLSILFTQIALAASSARSFSFCPPHSRSDASSCPSGDISFWPCHHARVWNKRGQFSASFTAVWVLLSSHFKLLLFLEPVPVGVSLKNAFPQTSDRACVELYQ